MEDPKKKKSDWLSEALKNKNVGAQPPVVSDDQKSVQAVKQSIKDDPLLAAVAKDIKVTVKEGAVTLDGEVSTEQQSALAARTAVAVEAVDEIDNRIEVKSKDQE